MSTLAWTVDNLGLAKGTVGGQWRYTIAGGSVWYREPHDGADWCFIGLASLGGRALAEAHWAGLPEKAPTPKLPTRRTLWVNGETMTGEVRSISTHTHSDGTQSIDISFVPDEAADTVRLIGSMGVDQ